MTTNRYAQVSVRAFLAGALFLLALAAVPATARAAPVEAELVLAIDVSQSISETELRVQLDGIAEAFRDERLKQAIAGLNGGLAVAVVFWAGETEQRIALPWRLLRGAADADGFAAALAQKLQSPWSGNAFTATGDALAFATAMLEGNGYESARRIIDVSSDDPQNTGLPAAAARDAAIARGITINGLALLNDRREHEDRAHLFGFFRGEVIGGPGAFVQPVLSDRDYAPAMLRKLILEIAAR